MTYPEAASENFYEGLEAVVSAFPLSDMLILLGDFNARVGKEQSGLGGCHQSSWSSEMQQYLCC